MKDRISEAGTARQKSSPWKKFLSSKNQGIPQAGLWRQSLRQFLALLVTFSFVLAPASWADNRTALRPGWNLFSVRQDVEVGQQVSRDAERQLRLLNDSRVDNYLNNLGLRLASRAPGEKYPYRFRAVNDRTINAFALPGGPVYVNRGVIEAADTESQLAGVMAHEISHVALRHGTNQASKAYIAQVPLAILGGALGSQSAGAVLAQLGAGFAVNSLLLKYSRSAESQADVMGTQILYDAGYDPRAMAQFFEKIQAEQPGRSVEFFSNHPNPGNRIQRVNDEIDRMGGPREGYSADSREFQDIRRYVLSLPAPGRRGGVSGTDGQARGYRLRILSASYGASGRYSDVRDRLSARIVNDRLNVIVNPSSMGGDPYRGRAKSLRVRYEWAGRNYEVVVYDNQRLYIPTDQQVRDSGGSGGLPGEYPSERMRQFQNELLAIQYPDNWEAYSQGDAVTIAPRGGMVDDSRGNRALATGVIINVWDPHLDTYNYGQQLQGPGYGTTQDDHQRLERATDQLVDELRQSNPNIRVIRRHQDITVDGQDATATYLSNDSPLGGRETDWLIAVMRPEGLVFIVFSAPDRDFQEYESTFQSMLSSVRFRR